MWDELWKYIFGEREYTLMRHTPWAIVKIAVAIALLEIVILWVIFLWVYGERIETLRERIQSRDDQIARLKATVDQPQSSQPQNNKTNEPQNDKTTEQLRLEELQRRQTQPYTIREADQKKFVETLSLAGKFSVKVTHDGNDFRSGLFAKELTHLLMMAGWKIDGPTEIFTIGGLPQQGVWISTNKEQEVPVGASILMDLLNDQEIDVYPLPAPPQHILPASFTIYIGLRS